MISDKNQRLVRDLTRILFILHVIPFTWSPAGKMYEFSPQRVFFSYLHVTITFSHLLLCLTQLSLCSAQIRVCYAFDVSALFFLLTFMSLVLTSHMTLLQDASQAAIGHNMIDKFVRKIKRKFSLFKK